MDETTVNRLNEINRQFYETVGPVFDETRSRPWDGWVAALPLLQKLAENRDQLSVLDVGCGNARFGLFLAAELPNVHWHYHGQDNNPHLLDRARATLGEVPKITFELEPRDIVRQPPDTGVYDLVALFGVMHHIPGSENRLALMRALGERIAPGGLLIFTCWRFLDDGKLRGRRAPWPADLPAEPGDALLDWRRGATALRYCHHVDDAEHSALVAASSLAEISRYRADGADNRANLYTLLSKSE